MKNVTDIKQILAFLHQAEALKNLLRHSWTSSNRQESVAEHSWRLALTVLLLQEKIDKEIDVAKALKMAIIHDLPEIYAGDHHAWKGKLKNKHSAEEKGLIKLTQNLPPKQRNQILKLWNEYEGRKTKEAKLVKALDKLETITQHNEASIKTWVKEEFTYNLVHGTEETNYNPLLKELKKLIDKETKKKISKARL